MEKQVCCICGKEFEGYGNNPEPVKHEGRCCNNCNQHVIIERIKLNALARLATNKVVEEIIVANEKEGVDGVNKVLKKYDLDLGIEIKEED